jgi:hypothetical protein
MRYYLHRFAILLALSSAACGTLDNGAKSNEAPTSAAQLALVPPDSATEVGATDSLASAVLISIEDTDGYAYYFNDTIGLRGESGRKITDPLALLPGAYQLTSFVVLDRDNNALFATPRADSQYAYLVNSPLPLAFDVRAEETAKVTPEVIAVAGPITSFGYAVGTFDVVPTIDFYLHVSVVANGESVTIPANLRVTNSLEDGAALYDRPLTAGTQRVRVRALTGTYALEISADGYQTQSLTLSE